MLNYFSGLIVRNFVNILLLNTPGVTPDGMLLNGNPIGVSWNNILCEQGINDVCAYGAQVEITETEDSVVSLSHINPDARLLGIAYSTDVRTGQATFGGMTQKPIACKFS